ncbi:TonB-system energizer ExbB [Helicobacter sp.]|uniref:TonB-system energizer ExbB n=1 Tax=Helicobacter sp. TaxID=218 RepID=UPI0025C3B24D|nr:TonB-system energizer ExbB [Helicobacter sp.]MCI5968735.1 TonB-system energizer ExbB [Helicobacter sp.]MDY2584558.1 TonB-system energizer ExbB [Helicobacter sp.]
MKEVVEYGVIGILVLMSVVALWASIERMLFYHYIKLVLYTNKTELEIDLSKNLTLIATIGSNAPYVGLLGTVFGIILTFVQLGQSGVVDTSSIMTGLALALQATAGGLLVAIPSIVFYNLLMRKSEVLIAQWEVLQEKDTKKGKE